MNGIIMCDIVGQSACRFVWRPVGTYGIGQVVSLQNTVIVFVGIIVHLILQLGYFRGVYICAYSYSI